MRESFRATIPVIILAALLLAASPSSADWLVTHAGGRVETRGPWQVKGKLVVFTQADGTLASLRLTDVDLEASAKATAEAPVPGQVPVPVEAPRKKLAVLTDDTIVHTKKPPAAAPAEEGDQDKKDKAETPSRPKGTVSVSQWTRAERPGGDGLDIQGTLQNNTDKIAANAGVEVQLFNEAGERIGTAVAIVNSPSIEPHGTVGFRANFPGVFSFAQAKFETKGWPLDLSPVQDKKGGEGSPP